MLWYAPPYTKSYLSLKCLNFRFWRFNIGNWQWYRRFSEESSYFQWNLFFEAYTWSPFESTRGMLLNNVLFITCQQPILNSQSSNFFCDLFKGLQMEFFWENQNLFVYSYLNRKLIPRRRKKYGKNGRFRIGS